jgi:hypothetical protein
MSNPRRTSPYGGQDTYVPDRSNPPQDVNALLPVGWSGARLSARRWEISAPPRARAEDPHAPKRVIVAELVWLYACEWGIKPVAAPNRWAAIWPTPAAALHALVTWWNRGTTTEQPTT